MVSSVRHKLPASVQTVSLEDGKVRRFLLSMPLAKFKMKDAIEQTKIVTCISRGNSLHIFKHFSWEVLPFKMLSLTAQFSIFYPNSFNIVSTLNCRKSKDSNFVVELLSSITHPFKIIDDSLDNFVGNFQAALI